VLLSSSTWGCGPDCSTPWYADRDGDRYGDRGDLVRSCKEVEGHVRDARDCDDEDKNVHPGASEACNGVDDDCDGEVDPDVHRYFADVDGDGIGAADNYIDACSAPNGFVPLAGDCNDADESAFPGSNFELCDGVDNDCDGLVDEDVEGDTWYYPDNDGDTWGVASQGQPLCAPPPDWVELAGDCADTDSSRYPGAVETCNGLDDDCDDLVDLADPGGVTGVIVVYADADLDNYGAGPGFLACSPVPGQSTVNTDCDDQEALVNPSGLEVCGGTDEDCDELVDEADPSVSPSSFVEGWLDGDGDGLGDPQAPAAVCALSDLVVANDLDCDDTDPRIGLDEWRLDGDGDGAGGVTLVEGTSCSPPNAAYVNVAALYDCDDDDPLVHEGAADPCGDGVDQDCTGLDPRCGSTEQLASLDEVARTWVEARGPTDLLLAASPPRDMDGDGAMDAWVGAPGVAEIRLLRGPVPESGLWEEALTVSGPPNSAFGSTLQPLSDLTGDGLPELAVGAPYSSEVQILASPQWTTIWGTVEGTAIGTAMTAVDADGLGSEELIIGQPTANQVALVALQPGTTQITTARTLYTSVSSAGMTVDCCADVEGDGVPELVLGAPLYTGASLYAGRVYLVPSDVTGSWSIGTVHRGFWEGTSQLRLGSALATGHDVDGDGLTDVLATGPTYNVDMGAAYLFSPTLSGEVDDAAIVVVEGFAGLQLGSYATLADLDADGLGDLVLGAPAADVGETDGGAVYVFMGPQPGSYSPLDADRIWYGSADQELGTYLYAGELDVDAGEDLWVGTKPSGGGLWLLPGG
jgi:hypothetical protein